MKKIGDIFLLITLFVLGGALIIQKIYKDNEIKELKRLAKPENTRAGIKNTNQMFFDLGVFMENEAVGFTNIQLKDTANNLTRIKSILPNKNTLFLKISNADCSTCIDTTLNILKEFYTALNGRFILLSDLHNPRQVKVLKSEYNIDAPLFLYNSLEFNFMPLDKDASPYFFVLDKNMKTQLVFRPDYSYPDRTRFYLHQIVKRFNN